MLQQQNKMSQRHVTLSKTALFSWQKSSDAWLSSYATLGAVSLLVSQRRPQCRYTALEFARESWPWHCSEPRLCPWLLTTLLSLTDCWQSVTVSGWVMLYGPRRVRRRTCQSPLMIGVTKSKDDLLFYLGILHMVPMASPNRTKACEVNNDDLFQSCLRQMASFYEDALRISEL